MPLVNSALRGLTQKKPQMHGVCIWGFTHGAVNAIRTHDLILTKDVLYRLSYVGIRTNTSPDNRRRRIPTRRPHRFAATVAQNVIIMVLGGGLEPPRITPYGPQPYASANSATRAYSAIGTTPTRENRDIIYSLPRVLQIIFSVFFAKSASKCFFCLKKAIPSRFFRCQEPYSDA